VFDDLIRELKRLGEAKVKVPIPTDEKGYLDRCCPSEECGQRFKVLCDLSLGELPESGFCPFCRIEAAREEFLTPEHRDFLEKTAIAHFGGLLDDIFETAARRSRSHPTQAGFFEITMDYRPGVRPVIVPLEATEAMRQEFTCEECGCGYAAIGTAFFCPSCGHNSVITAFGGAVEAVRGTIANLPAIRQAVAASAGEDIAADSARSILESLLVRLVGTFQQFAESMFVRSPAAATVTPRRNAFQNLREGHELWRAASGKGYEDWLKPLEYRALSRLFQQRHLLAHRDGIIDQEYIDRSGDAAYASGQRLVVKEGDVLLLADLVAKLAGSIRSAVAL
jgi:hypothetical protein